MFDTPPPLLSENITVTYAVFTLLVSPGRVPILSPSRYLSARIINRRPFLHCIRVRPFELTQAISDLQLLMF